MSAPVAVPRRRPDPITTALLAVPPLILTIGAWLHRWMSDDGFIYLRVVQNTVAGHGPVFNAGERVEAATGPLWTFVLVLGDAVLPVRLEWIAVGLGILFTVAGLVFSMRGAARLVRVFDEQATLFPLGALVLASVPVVWDYATSGLETGLIWLWLGVTFDALTRWTTRADRERVRVPLHLAVLVGLGPLIRPDLAVVTVALLVVLLVRGAGLGDRVRAAIAALAAPVAYEIFRAGYYGALVPNPAIAKESGVARWSQGVRYLSDFFRVYWLWIPVGLLAVVVGLLAVRLWGDARRTSSAAVVALVVAGLVEALYVVRVGGSHMHGRLLIPTLITLAIPVAVVPVRRTAATVAAVGVALVWSVVCIAMLRPPTPGAAEYRRGIIDLRSAFTTIDSHPVTVEAHIRRLGKGVAPVRHSPAGPVAIPFGLPGALAYHYGPSVYVLDDFGLGDWFTARLPLDVHRYPDHQKYLTPEWGVARLDLDHRYPTGALRGDTPATRAAAIALRCGDLAELHRAVSAPLDLNRFLANLGVAVRLNSLRVPQQPAAAVRRFCHR